MIQSPAPYPNESAGNSAPDDQDFDGMLAPALEEVLAVSGLEGLAVLDRATNRNEPQVLYRIGLGGLSTIHDGRSLLLANPSGPAHTVSLDRRPILVCPWQMAPARTGGLIFWRNPGARRWQEADYALMSVAGVLLRSLVAACVGQIGIDRLTGLPNRRWFIDEVDRHIDRLDLDGRVGTLSVIEVGNLTRVSTALGREAGNDVLVRLSTQLRMTVRPGDAVARIGADRFAVWQPAMDHLTAAERANALCGLRLFPDLPASSNVTLSVGIVSHDPAGGEDTRDLLTRALAAIDVVRQQGIGGWRVALRHAQSLR